MKGGGRLFGAIVCDVCVPDNLKPAFAEMLLIKKNVEISINDVGSYIKNLCESLDEFKTPRRAVTSSFFCKQAMVTSQLLRWYLSKGLLVENVTAFIKYTPKACFGQFMNQVVAARWKADANTCDSAAGNTAKLIGNALYGKTITNREKFNNVKYCDSKNSTKYINNLLFHQMEPISLNLYEVLTRRG